MEAILEILTTEDMTELRQGIKNLILNAVESDFNALNEHIVPPNFVIEVIDDVISNRYTSQDIQDFRRRRNIL